MKILSIDWDYFFPDNTPYDWGAHESNWVFYEIVWSARCSAQNIITKADMLEEYIPNIPENFWSIVTNKPKIIVADSHCQIWNQLPRNSTVYNLDAHHDCGYHEKDHVDCSNWGQYGLLLDKIKKLKVFYPTWRRNSPESKPLFGPSSTDYGLPRKQKFDLIFVCRSSCWTPPWWDPTFDDFLSKSGLEIEKLDDLVKKHRNLPFEQALKLRDQFRVMQEQVLVQ